MTGSECNDSMTDQVIKLSDALNAHVAATANSIAKFKEAGFERCSKEWIAEIANLMTTADWAGINGKGKPDLIIFAGYFSTLLNRFLTTFKYFTDCETLTLDNRAMSNATYSLEPSSSSEWEANLKKIVDNL